MEDNTSRHSTDRNMQFNIGKALGLKGQANSIDTYRNQLLEINGEFQTQASNSTNTYCTDLVTIENDFKAKRLAMQKDCLDFVKDIKGLKDELNGILDEELKKNQTLYADIEKICQAAVQRFEQKIKQIEKIDDGFIERLQKTEELLTDLKTNATTALEGYLSTLLSRQLDFEEMECGYWYGEALRITLGDETQKEAK